MSRVGKNPVPVPANVEVTLSASEVSVKGPLGTLRRNLVSDIAVERDGDNLLVKACERFQAGKCHVRYDARAAGQYGQRVTNGFEKKLTLVGVGYRAQAAGDVLNLTLGFSHPVAHKMPEGVKAETPSSNRESLSRE